MPIALATPIADAEEAPLAAANELLFERLHLPSPHRGGRSVSVPAELATKLHSSLQLCFQRGLKSGHAGGLHVVNPNANVFDEQSTREHVFWGFETYERVQAPLVKSEQKRYTTMLPVHEFEETLWRALLFNGLDGLETLITLAKAEAGGLTLLACHMLRQDSLQACFRWHQDNKNNPFTKLSMVFLLSDVGTSTMRVAGYEPFVYDGPGSGCAFPSEAHHRSGGSSVGTFKSALSTQSNHCLPGLLRSVIMLTHAA